MSGGGPFDRFTGGNALMAPRQAPQPAAATAQQPTQRSSGHHVPMHYVRQTQANTSQADMIRKRDSFGDVADQLANIANSDDINRADVVAYLGGLVGKGDVPAGEAAVILKALPQDQEGMRQWARMMFAAVSNVAIHAHAAYPKEVFPGEGEEPAQEEAPSE